jgi:hypothetical protein
MDLALTATYFPHCNLTFGILFGCPLSVEEEIVKRLSFATAEAAHPLLMPGIFAEIERCRHVHVVEATIDELETKIFELDGPSDRDGMSSSEAERRNQEKRSSWLDTTYLRNGLVSWNTQLVKMSDHADELKTTVFKPAKFEENITNTRTRWKDDVSDVLVKDFKPRSVALSKQSELSYGSCVDSKGRSDEEQSTFHEDHVQEPINGEEVRIEQEYEASIEAVKQQMRQVGHKIKHRIQAINDEYNEKIRDCTMRVDGMAMATQWVTSSGKSLNFVK